MSSIKEAWLITPSCDTDVLANERRVINRTFRVMFSESVQGTFPPKYMYLADPCLGYVWKVARSRVVDLDSALVLVVLDRNVSALQYRNIL